MRKMLLLLSIMSGALAVATAPLLAQQQTVSITQAAGSESVVVRGHAAPGAVVSLVLIATISEDVPDVTVGRYSAHADSNGDYQAILPLAPDFVRNTIVRVIAASAGMPDSSAQLVTGAPNAGTAVPLEQQTP